MAGDLIVWLGFVVSKTTESSCVAKLRCPSLVFSRKVTVICLYIGRT